MAEAPALKAGEAGAGLLAEFDGASAVDLPGDFGDLLFDRVFGGVGGDGLGGRVPLDGVNDNAGELGCAFAALGVCLGEGEGCAILLAELLERAEVFVAVVWEAVDGDDDGRWKPRTMPMCFCRLAKPAWSEPSPWLRTLWTVVTRTAADGLMPEDGMTRSMYFSKPRSEAKPVSLTA